MKWSYRNRTSALPDLLVAFRKKIFLLMCGSSGNLTSPIVRYHANQLAIQLLLGGLCSQRLATISVKLRCISVMFASWVFLWILSVNNVKKCLNNAFQGGVECAAVPHCGQFYNVLYLLLYRTQKSTLFLVSLC